MGFSFAPITLPPGAAAFRQEVRGFLDGEMAGVAPEHRINCWARFDAGFSRKLGARGWLGLTWPARYGGGDRSPIERYVLTEELLAAGAPVGAHWIADRQSGPLLLRFGTEAQRERYLRPITRGEMFFCIGMSEPGAGSDLASVRTRATRTNTGWRVNGQKIWTTHAHNSHMMIALVRTGEGSERQAGLSQLLIDLAAPGITIRPITDLTGDRHFAEVFFDDVDVPEGNLVGEEGQGWRQVTAELSLERSGPERFLSSYQALVELLRHVGPEPAEPARSGIGRMVAELWTLRQMSISVAGKLAAGEDPALEACIVKDMGNSFEQDMARTIEALLDDGAAPGDGTALGATLAQLVMVSPSFSMRGGTREVLRGVIARGLGLR